MKNIFSDLQRQVVGHELEVFLANTYTLYFKTLSAHWNVSDPRFLFLHEMFQSQYEALAEKGDEIAERLRMMGLYPPSSMKAFLSKSQFREFEKPHTAQEYIEALAEDHAQTCIFLQTAIRKSEECKDYGAIDFFSEALREHEKTVWFLRSHL